MRRPVVTIAGFAVAVAVVALLAGVLIPSVSRPDTDEKPARAAEDLERIANAFTSFRLHTKCWPSPGTPGPLTGLGTANDDLGAYECLSSNPSRLPGWKGPYLDLGKPAPGQPFVDPWGQPYRIYTFASTPGNGGAIVILCRGGDAEIDSSPHDVLAGHPAGDDLVKVVTRHP